MTDCMTLFLAYYIFNVLFGTALFLFEVPKGPTTTIAKAIALVLGCVWPVSFPCLIWVCIQERREYPSPPDPNFIKKFDENDK